MNITNYTVKREGREWIGDSVARLLNGLDNPKIITVISKILTIYATSPERYEVTEVTEVDVLVQE